MGAGKRNYLAVAVIVVGLVILFWALLFVSQDPLGYLSYVCMGAALSMSGVVFFFVQFQAERRYCSTCMLTFSLCTFIGILVFTVLYAPPTPLTYGMAWVFCLIGLVTGVLFWFFEPKGSGSGCSGVDCSGCESCGPGLLLFIALFLCGLVYILETASINPFGALLIVALLLIGFLLHLARMKRK